MVDISRQKLKIGQYEPHFKKRGWVSISCSTSGTHRVALVTNPVICNHGRGKDGIMITTNDKTYSVTVTKSRWGL